MRGTGCVGAAGNKENRVFPGPKSFRYQRRPVSGRLHPAARGRTSSVNGARPPTAELKGQNVSYRNESLQRKSGLDYSMQYC